MWKLKKFTVTQILREINSVSKTAILTKVPEMFKMAFLKLYVDFRKLISRNFEWQKNDWISTQCLTSIGKMFKGILNKLNNVNETKAVFASKMLFSSTRT